MSEFFIPKIEIRSKLKDGVKQYIIKGYAATAGNIYSYQHSKDKAFREYFTNDAIENIRQKAKSEHIWVDYGHQTAFGANLTKAFTDIETRSGLNLNQEKNFLNEAFRVGDIPMFKVEDIDIDDKGLFIEIHANPFYKEVDEQHSKYFDAVWNSLDNGFINGMSLNMKPISFVDINDGLRQIDDVEVYGISLVSGAANNMANITEVAMRCCMKRGEDVCQKIRTSLML